MRIPSFIEHSAGKYIEVPNPIQKEKFHPIANLPEFAFMEINPKNMETEKGKEYAADQMLEQIKKWPKFYAVISMAPDSSNNTDLLVASQDKAIQGSVLKGVYEVVQRLSSSAFVKEAAKKYPTQFAVVTPLSAKKKYFHHPLPWSAKS